MPYEKENSHHESHEFKENNKNYIIPFKTSRVNQKIIKTVQNPISKWIQLELVDNFKWPKKKKVFETS